MSKLSFFSLLRSGCIAARVLLAHENAIRTNMTPAEHSYGVCEYQQWGCTRYKYSLRCTHFYTGVLQYDYSWL